MLINENLDSIQNDNCDCMIINLWSACNYGASLTCLGVTQLLEKLKFKVKVINYVPELHRGYETSFSKSFAEKYLDLTKPIKSYDDFLQLNTKSKIFIAGSDQIFNTFVMNTHNSDVTPYIYLLDFVKKAKVINSVSAIRNFNEKLHAVLFSKLLPEYLVTANRDEISEFLKLHKEIILKPLNKCFGAGVMYLKYGDYNTRNILNLATNDGKSIIMVQKYLPSVKEGDKRVLILGEQVLKYGVRKIPTSDDFKFNTHSDDYVKGELLSNAEIELFKPIAKELNSMGIYMAGLDVVGDKVIEINVTSPCYFIKEINNAFNVRLDEKICDFIESIA